MKQKHFYSNLVHFDVLSIELDKLGVSQIEKEELLLIAHSSLHFTIIDVVLSHLSKEDKKTFLSHMHKNNHDKTWKFLKEKIADVENKIAKSIQNVEKDLLSDINHSH